MQALVTGATGFIGSHLVERLLAEGVGVRCLMRPVSPRGGAQRHIPPHAARPVLGDLVTGAGLQEALDGVDVVYHLAGTTKALSTAEYYSGNVTATQQLLRACTGRRPRLVHVSSLAAAGPSADGVPLREDGSPQPLTHYGKSKLEGEQAVRQSEMAENSVIIRPPVVYGPRDTDVFAVFRGVASGMMVRIGRGESYFSYVYVSDLVDGLLLAGSSPEAAGKTFYVASPKPASWSEFGAIAGAVMLKEPRTLRVPAWAAYMAGAAAEQFSRYSGRAGIVSREKIVEARQRYWTCDVSAAEAGLGFRAQTSLREGVAATLEWYREAHWLTY
ncbi:MAG: NAD(P)-dependent oxidoreductase [Bryobacteraceae bacterium]